MADEKSCHDERAESNAMACAATIAGMLSFDHKASTATDLLRELWLHRPYDFTTPCLAATLHAMAPLMTDPKNDTTGCEAVYGLVDRLVPRRRLYGPAGLLNTDPAFARIENWLLGPFSGGELADAETLQRTVFKNNTEQYDATVTQFVGRVPYRFPNITYTDMWPALVVLRAHGHL